MSLLLLLVIQGFIMQIIMLVILWKILNIQRQKCSNPSSTSSGKTESNKEANLCFISYGNDEDSWSSNYSKKNPKKKCFECNKEGHLRPDCPTLLKRQKKGSKKRSKSKKKDKNYIDWDKTASSSTMSNIAKDNMAFTVGTTTNSNEESDYEVSDSNSNSNGYNHEQLQEAFSELVEYSEKLISNNKRLKKQMEIQTQESNSFKEIVIKLRNENSDLKKQIDDISKNGCDNCKLNSHLICEQCKTFEEKVYMLEKENSILINKNETLSSNASKVENQLLKPCESCKTLTQKLDILENNLAKFSKAKTDLESFLKVQRTMNDKTGLGYKNVSKKGKRKIFQKPKNQSVLPSITCNYCMLTGHISTDCNVRKYGVPKGNYAWIKKANKGISNKHGSKTVWIPKSS